MGPYGPLTHGSSPHIGQEKKLIQLLLLQGQSKKPIVECGFQHSSYEMIDDDIFGIEDVYIEKVRIVVTPSMIVVIIILILSSYLPRDSC